MGNGRPRPGVLVGAALCALLSACAGDGEASSGSFSLLTYNVAGLPQGLSHSNPEHNIPLISPLLSAHDLVLVQEDFAYDDELRADVTLPYASTHLAHGPGKVLGDGLNRFSRNAFADHTREAWTVCYGLADNGSDCLAAKGFTRARTTLAPGVEVDVYNLHMDAGNGAEDNAARATQVDQLLAAIAQHSAGRALIVAGDTNLKIDAGRGDDALLDKLLADAGLVDACRSLACGDERIDRVLLRSNAEVSVTAQSWGLDGRFVDEQGGPLSDHEAVAVRIDWQRAP